VSKNVTRNEKFYTVIRGALSTIEKISSTKKVFALSKKEQ